ncbi:MAG TPA: hypothetical protein DEP43_04785 [Ruminococcaceae bacterium]|nr:hypothetical protein [Oscillospiraceae bacterium]
MFSVLFHFQFLRFYEPFFIKILQNPTSEKSKRSVAALSLGFSVFANPKAEPENHCPVLCCLLLSVFPSCKER